MNRPLPYLNKFVKRQEDAQSKLKNGGQMSELNAKMALARKKSFESQEVIRLKKQVEDSGYLVAKVKEERNQGLIRIEKLQKQLSQVNDKMRKDLSKVREYMARRIQLRESVYKEEIQTMVTSFNRNYQLNMTMMQNLINEKFDYEEEIRDLKQSNQDFITKQSENFQTLIAEMEKHKQAVDDQLKDSNQKLNDREATITQLNDQIDRLNEELEQLRNSYKNLQEKKEEEDQKFTMTINELNLKLTESQGLTHEQTMMIERLTSENRSQDEQIQSLTNIIAEHVRQKNQIHNQNMKLIDVREQLTNTNHILNMKNEQLDQQLKDLHTEVDKMRLEYEEMISKLRTDMDQRFAANLKEIQEQKDHNLTLSQRIEELFHEKEMQVLRVTELEGTVLQKDDQIQIFKKELQHGKQMAEQLTKEMTQNVQKFKQHQNELTDRLTEYIQKANQLQTENVQLHSQLRELNITTQDELAKMKDQYEVLTESNKRLMEDQIEMLRKAKDQDQVLANNMRNQYELQLNNMMETHRSQIEELERVYREDSDKKDGEIYQALQQKTHLFDEFQAFKFKVQMQQAEKDHEIELLKMKKGMAHKKSKMSEIEELENQDDIQEIQSQGDEEEIVPVKKTKKAKPIKIQDLEEEEVDSEKWLEESSKEEDENEVSVFQLLKQKKKEKSSSKGGKVKLKKKLVRNKDDQQEIIGQFDLSKDVEESQQNQPKQMEKQPSSEKLVEQQEQIVEPIKKKPSKQKIKQIQSPKKKKKTQPAIDLDQILAEKAQLEERIIELEEQNDALKLSQKTLKNKMQREEKKYLSKIKLLEEQINSLNSEIESLFLKINEQDSKFAESYKQQSERKKKQLEVAEENRKKREEEEEKKVKVAEEELKKQQQKLAMQSKEPPSPRSIASRKSRKILKHEDGSEDQSKKSRLKQKPVDEEKYKRKIQNLEEMLLEKQKKIEKIQEQNQNLSRQIVTVRKQVTEKVPMHQSKILDQQRIPYSPTLQPSFPQPSFGGESFMKQSLANLEDKVSNEKQKYSELKIKFDQKHRQNQELIYEVRKLKTTINELQDKDQKRIVPRSSQELQSQIEEGNRKILQLSRNVNQARLERDTLEDQLRIIKKKLAQLTKASQESEARACENERQVQDLKRKEQKYKRQIQQYQQDIKRIKEINRKTLEQLSEVRKSQSQFVIERKKVLDQVVRLEGVVAQKDTDMVKVNKQMEKLRSKINDTTEGRQGRERQYRGEMQKLEIERSKMDRKNREQEQTIKVLKQKLDVLEKEAKKLTEERKQSYVEKLKYYINQIASIKEIVQEYQQENTQLKHQNSEFFDQNEMLKASFQKLQIKYEEQTQKATLLQQELASAKQKIIELDNAIKIKSSQEEKSKILVSSLRKELDNQRLVGRKRTEKCQQLQQINQRCLYDIKRLKISLNDYEVNTDDKNKMAEQLFASQKTIGSLQEELNRIAEQHHVYTERYVYTLEDVQKAIRQMKEHQDRVKQQQMTKIILELDQSSSENRQKMESQLLTLYNQNQKLRVNLHKANEDFLEMQLQMAELENLRDKVKLYEKDKSSLERRVVELTDDLKGAREESRRLQIKFNESIRNQENKTTENVVILQKYQDLNKRYQDLNENYQQLKQEDKKLLQKYKNNSDEKDETIQKMTNEIQTLNNKLLANELQINRLKELDSINSQDYFKNKKKLENRINQINQASKIKERELEVQFKTQLRDLKTKTTKLEEEMDEKMRRIQELEEGIFMLQSQVQELTAELTDARTQLSEEGQLYTLQINKLRNQMRENQQTYDHNLRTLEEELSAMNKQLTTLKFARENITNSRLRMSRQLDNSDERGSKKLQQKMIFKDRRIEQLQ